MKKAFAFIFIICVSVLPSCSMQKRLYTKGFYSHRSKTLKNPEASANADTLSGVTTNNRAFKIQKTKVKRKGEELTAAASPFIVLPSVFTDACDTIILKNGAKITASIKDANSTEIKYKTCPNSNGITLTLKKSDVNRIHYGNGRTEVFEEEHAYNQPANLPDSKFEAFNTTYHNERDRRRFENSEKTTSGFSIVGFVFSFIPVQVGIIFAILNAEGNISIGAGVSSIAIGWIIFPLFFASMALMLSMIAYIQIKRHNDTLKGLGMATFGIFLSLLIVVALLAIISF